MKAPRARSYTVGKGPTGSNGAERANDAGLFLGGKMPNGEAGFRAIDIAINSPVRPDTLDQVICGSVRRTQHFIDIAQQVGFLIEFKHSLGIPAEGFIVGTATYGDNLVQQIGTSAE